MEKIGGEQGTEIENTINNIEEGVYVYDNAMYDAEEHTADVNQIHHAVKRTSVTENTVEQYVRYSKRMGSSGASQIPSRPVLHAYIKRKITPQGVGGSENVVDAQK